MALRALTVVLNRGKMQQQLAPQVSQDYLGGRGAIAWLLFHQLPPDTSPRAAENLLVFAVGPLAGTHAPIADGFVVGTRSPLTGGIGYSWASGGWGTALRRAGHDLLILSGRAADWCYLQIDGERVLLRPAGHLVGLDTQKTVTTLRQELGNDYVILCIGPAAEAGVAYGSIVAEGRYIAEPAGTGTVMADKRVKAIAVRGGSPVTVMDERKLNAASDIITRRMERSPLAQSIAQFGSMHYFPQTAEWGALTGKNGQHGNLDERFLDIRSVLAQRGRKDNRHYLGLPLLSLGEQAPPPDAPLPLPELELVAGFGARCGITDPDALIAIADHCLRLGLDPAATSAAIAFMMECQEAGLNRAGTLPWGDDEAVLASLTRLGQQQEKRDVLSLGVGEMQEIFFGSASFAPQVKGLAMPALDPRALTGMGLAMATAPIGGDYRYAMSYEELLPEPPAWLPDEPSHPHAVKGKAIRLIWHERFAAVLDAIGVCRRLGLMAYQVTPFELIALITAITGQPMNGPELARLGERIVTIERLFALKNCDDGAVDGLPPRWRECPLTEGRAAGHLPALGDLLPEYYRRHGWNHMGQPLPARLAELGIKS